MGVLTHGDRAWLKVQFHWHRLRWLIFASWPLALFAGLWVSWAYQDMSYDIRFLFIPLFMAHGSAYLVPWERETFHWTLPLSPRRAFGLLVLSQGGLIVALSLLPVIHRWSEIPDPWKCCRVLLLASVSGGGGAAIGLWSHCHRKLRQPTPFSTRCAALFSDLFGMSSHSLRLGHTKLSHYQWRGLVLLPPSVIICWVLFLFPPLRSHLEGVMLYLGLFTVLPGARLMGFHIDDHFGADNSPFVRTLPIRLWRALRLHLLRGVSVYVGLVALLTFLSITFFPLIHPERSSLGGFAQDGLLPFHIGACVGVAALLIGVRVNSRGNRALPDILWVLLMIAALGASAGIGYAVARVWGVVALLSAWVFIAWFFIPILDWQREA